VILSKYSKSFESHNCSDEKKVLHCFGSQKDKSKKKDHHTCLIPKDTVNSNKVAGVFIHSFQWLSRKVIKNKFTVSEQISIAHALSPLCPKVTNSKQQEMEMSYRKTGIFQ